MTTATKVQIEDGRYTLVYPTGDYRTVWVRTQKEGKWAAGARILKLKQGHSWVGCAFVQPDGKLRFWNRFKAENPPERMVRIQRAVDRIMADPSAAGLAYAMQENCCYRCGRELSVPASIHKGMGPECARRSVTRELNKQAYDWRASQTTVPAKKTAPDPVSAPAIPFPDPLPYTGADEADAEAVAMEREMDRLFQQSENEQEARAHMSGPDVYNPNDPFWSETCGICGRPRNECSC